MLDDIFDPIHSCLSIERLTGFTPAGKKCEDLIGGKATLWADDPTDRLLRYLWNIRLCEALYPSLQSLEVALRNAIHNDFAEKYAEDWMTNGKILQAREFQQVEDAIKKLRSRQKAITPNRIVAELSFGFWTSLFNVKYETSLWRNDSLKIIFPYAQNYFRKRQNISALLTSIRDLRNRAFHYEPLWAMPLQMTHNVIIELILYINPHAFRMNSLVDRFEAVYSLGTTPFHGNFHFVPHGPVKIIRETPAGPRIPNALFACTP